MSQGQNIGLTSSPEFLSVPLRSARNAAAEPKRFLLLILNQLQIAKTQPKQQQLLSRPATDTDTAAENCLSYIYRHAMALTGINKLELELYSLCSALCALLDSTIRQRCVCVINLNLCVLIAIAVFSVWMCESYILCAISHFSVPYLHIPHTQR